MTKIAFAAGAAVFVLAGAGMMAVPVWALVLAAGGMGVALLRRRSAPGDSEVTC